MPIHLEGSYIQAGTIFSNVKTGTISTQTGGSSPTMTITCSGFALEENAVVYFPTTYIQSGVTSVLLNINSTGAKTLYYNGAPLSYTNGRWIGPKGTDENSNFIYEEIVGVYYDGTNYQQFVRFDRNDALGKLLIQIIDFGWYNYIVLTNEDLPTV